MITGRSKKLFLWKNIFFGETMKEKQKELIVCPQCGSTDLRWLLGGYTGDQYKCPRCNYQGIALKGSIRFIREFKKRAESK